jgi:isoleucyl-tRNA synthetase
MVCIGSINELIELSGVKEINDLHRDTIDKISIPSKKTPGTYLKRVDDVFDCWFESGSVILAQDHYPFDKKEFVPADFICEGIDQTRGWFYTQLVLSVALFGKAPYKQVVCGGLILDEHGNKMSKSKGNVISPTTMIDKYGADFFRLYVVTSPASRAEEFKFSDKELYDLKKKLGPWMNAYNFYLGMKEFYETNFKESIDDFIVTDEHKTIFDIWIENRTEQFKYLLLECYKTNNFDFKDIILEFAEDLTNIYIKFNRHRLKRSTKQDRIIGIKTLESVLRKATIVITPIMPFW